MTRLKRVGVVYDGSYYTFRWLKSLLWAKDEFRKLGVEISFLGALQYLPIKGNRVPSGHSIRLKKLDALFVAHHHSHAAGIGGLSPDKLSNILEDLGSACNTLVWLDSADSTGTCRFDVLPYVALYFKKQILRDKERYVRPLWGGRLYCDYYHDQYGIEDDDISREQFAVLDREYLGKLRVSWNVGLGDLFSNSKYYSYLSARMAQPAVKSAAAPRSMDVHFRGSAWSSAAGWQRSKARELLAVRRDLSYPDLDSKVSYRRYIREMQQSKLVVSPYGWGEICGRDFEAMACGALLVKPSMEHLETFPNLYKPYETYVPIDWDFSNFYDQLTSALSNEKTRTAIAENAQRSFCRARSDDAGREAFAHHIVRNLGWL